MPPQTTGEDSWFWIWAMNHGGALTGESSLTEHPFQYFIKGLITEPAPHE